jgi:chemotaxis family two-component system response regulator Rcp1
MTMPQNRNDDPIEILLVEDNPADAILMREALRDATVRNNLHVVGDGEDAMAFLRHQDRYADAVVPDLIMLDLNLPKRDGRSVLREIKEDPELKRIPVVVVTSSQAEEDILGSYDLHANCYVTKPVDFDQFIKLMQTIEEFWFTVVKLPPKGPWRGERA